MPNRESQPLGRALRCRLPALLLALVIPGACSEAASPTSQAAPAASATPAAPAATPAAALDLAASQDAAMVAAGGAIGERSDEADGRSERPTDPRTPLVIGADADPEAPFSQAWVEQTYVEVIDALAAGAGIVMREPVPVVVAGNKEALERRREFARTLDDNEGLTYGQDMAADFLMGDHILGRYFPDEKAFYLFEENVLRDQGDDSLAETREFIWAIMAHELVHAYDDQVYESVPTIDKVLVDIGTGDRMGEVNAMMTLLEGRATYAAELACESAGVKKLRVRTKEEVRDAKLMTSDGSLGQDVGAGVLNFIARGKLAQYVAGREFAMHAYQMGGEKFFGEVFGSLPLSMAEVEDFDVFFIRWAGEMEARGEGAGP